MIYVVAIILLIFLFVGFIMTNVPPKRTAAQILKDKAEKHKQKQQ